MRHELTHLGQMPLDTRMKNLDKNLITYLWESVSDRENSELEIPGSRWKGNLHPLTVSSHWLLGRRAGGRARALRKHPWPWDAGLGERSEQPGGKGAMLCWISICPRGEERPRTEGNMLSQRPLVKTAVVRGREESTGEGPGPARTCGLRQEARPQDPGLPLFRATEPPLSHHHTRSPSPS